MDDAIDHLAEHDTNEAVGPVLKAMRAAGAALLAIDEVMTLWADDRSIPDPLSLLDQGFHILDGPLLFP
jgi:hypothetical protein